MAALRVRYAEATAANGLLDRHFWVLQIVGMGSLAGTRVFTSFVPMSLVQFDAKRPKM